MEFKSYRYIDGKARWVISDEKDNILDKNPTKDKLKGVILGEPQRKCCKCGNKTHISKGRPIWFKDRDKYDNWTKKYVCYNCHYDIGKCHYDIGKFKATFFKGRFCFICGKDLSIGHRHGRKYNDENGEWDGKTFSCETCYQKFNQNSHNNIIKSMAKSRNMQLSIYSERGKGLMGELVIGKVLGIVNCNIKNDNFNYPIDLYDDVRYKKISVKTVTLSNGRWCARNINNNFDNLFIICIDNKFNIKRIYIFPKEVVGNRTCIDIFEKPSRQVWYNNWYKNFIIDNDSYNIALQNLISYLKNDEFFNIEDIKKWQKGGMQY